MTNLSIIILTGNEQIHIDRCIQNAKKLTSKIYIVDSHSEDETVQIAVKEGVNVYLNKWPGNQADQFNWGLENIPIDTEWILRMDADELLTDNLINEIKEQIEVLPKDVHGIFLPLQRAFMGKILKYEKGIKILRIWRTGKGFYEKRPMDERVLIPNGKTVTFKYPFIDDNLNSIEWWTIKHINYASKEASVELGKLAGITNDDEIQNHQGYAYKIRKQKNYYSSLPLFVRPILYFLYRYVIKLGFLDGVEGFMWHFFQGWWYRTLVDAKIWEIKKACGTNPEKIKAYISKNYKIEL